MTNNLIDLGRENIENGPDIPEFGARAAAGRTFTGISIPHSSVDAAAYSEVFLGYPLSETLRISVSGTLPDESSHGNSVDEAVARMGLSASYSINNGTYVRGGVADGPDVSAMFGLAVGFRF